MTKTQRLSNMAFSLFSSYLLAFLFEGQLLFSFAEKYDINIRSVGFASVAANFIGLLFCWLIVKTLKQAKRIMLFSYSFCILATIPFFYEPSFLWYISLLFSSFMAGLSVAAWGFYFKSFTSRNDRIKTAANVLIISNAFMILINVITEYLSPSIGLIVSQVILIVALILQYKTTDVIDFEEKDNVSGYTEDVKKPLVILCLFIALITINSGLMYSVINPAFKHLKWLVSWYWAIPYIIAVFLIKKLPKKLNRNYILYLAIAMIGFAFIAFMVLDRSAIGYFIVNTLMLGACGIYDLFWWSILGEMLDFHYNPSKILGIGLSANVFGILLGGLIGSISGVTGIENGTSILAIGVVFTSLIILPLLHKYLSIILRNQEFLLSLYEMSSTKQDEVIDSIIWTGKLTEREGEIVGLLFKGRTYKMIADELYLSENTIKTHIKNIYSKLQVKSKTELMKLVIKE